MFQKFGLSRATNAASLDGGPLEEKARLREARGHGAGETDRPPWPPPVKKGAGFVELWAEVRPFSLQFGGRVCYNKKTCKTLGGRCLVQIRIRNLTPPHLCHHLPSRRWQDHPDREVPALRWSHRPGRCGQGKKEQPRRHLRLDGDRKAARHLRHLLGHAVPV